MRGVAVALALAINRPADIVMAIMRHCACASQN